MNACRVSRSVARGLQALHHHLIAGVLRHATDDERGQQRRHVHGLCEKHRPIASASTALSYPPCLRPSQTSPTPPGTLEITIATVAASPPNMTQNCITSFQITA